MWIPVCSDCGEELCFTTKDNFNMIIEPCENCLQQAINEAEDIANKVLKTGKLQ